MTNKEKYPNACVDSVNFSHGTQYYVVLLKDGNNTKYLANGKPNEDCRNGWHNTHEQAQAALNKFMNEPPPITLAEIKTQLQEAKKLINKRVRYSIGETMYTEKCEKVFFALERADNTSPLMEKEIDKKGYCIGVRTCARHTISLSMCEEVKTVTVTAHDGQKYSAESDGDCWKFGCAKISKSLVGDVMQLFEKSTVGNRKLEKVTIGKCDFDYQILKELTELEN